LLLGWEELSSRLLTTSLQEAEVRLPLYRFQSRATFAKEDISLPYFSILLEVTA
jgi:hypothetical protein